MKICYEITVDDLVAFNRYHVEHSKVLRRQRIARIIIVPAIVIVLTALVSLESHEPAFFVGGVLIASLLAILMARSFWQTLERNVRKMYGEGSNKGLLGPHELELSGDRLIHRSPFVETKYRFEMVERVASTTDHTFVYVSAVNAHIIPHHAVSDGDYEAIIEAIRRRLPETHHRDANSLLVD